MLVRALDDGLARLDLAVVTDFFVSESSTFSDNFLGVVAFAATLVTADFFFIGVLTATDLVFTDLLFNGVLAAGFFLAVAFLTRVAGDGDVTTAFLLTTILTILSGKRLKRT
ncbi:MAG: hypothetical protein L7S59_03250 [Pseudomonadales bacterium]|nr:hypothetical protein [Pseudomonadales bacterium]